ncbi:MAG: helix-hairpin-helix domain-containing protein [Myxococcales bacterium]|nr:helix-hairpin-helix domain-containing protein [Myxococcales bacterium]
MDSEQSVTPACKARIAGSHGYRIDGDLAILDADLAFLSPDALGAQWALQLWACREPHAGGPLTGTKVAEAPVDPAGAVPGVPAHMRAEVPARVPAAQPPLARGGHAMVLVLASGSAGTFEQVHDFANFPEPQPFHVPRFAGAVGYAIDGSSVNLRAERVENPRASDNLSGSLCLELRALDGGTAEPGEAGLVLASAPIGRLSGRSSEGVDAPAAFTPPPPGTWRMALVLREWTSDGFVSRDLRVFAAPYESDAPALTDAPAPAPALTHAPALTPAEPPLTHAEPPLTPTEPPRVSIQTASVDALAAVKGLTRKLALEIVKARPFRSLDELVRVKGIGEKTARKLRGLLAV